MGLLVYGELICSSQRVFNITRVISIAGLSKALCSPSPQPVQGENGSTHTHARHNAFTETPTHWESAAHPSANLIGSSETVQRALSAGRTSSHLYIHTHPSLTSTHSLYHRDARACLLSHPYGAHIPPHYGADIVYPLHKNKNTQFVFLCICA